MVIVTFWNNNTGKIGQTHSALAIASYMGVEHNYKTLLMATKYNDQVAMQAFGANERKKTIGLFTNNKQTMDLESGIEGMSKLATANRLSPEMVPNYTKIVYKNRLEVVTAPKKKMDLDYMKIYRSCEDILNVAKRYYDIIFVDLNNGIEDETTKEILKMSDIVILNIEQKLSEFEKLAELKQEKELFTAKNLIPMINRYDRKSKYSSKNVSRELGEKKEILTIPYSNLFAEAVQEGTVAEFFINTRLKKLEDSNDRTTFFVQEVKRATDALIYKMQELQMRI
ncbi:MAG: hypothetical protein HFJ52_01150 [Clostridia bacterium]|nr:hypothetical protein [Clostridia bacterium]